MALLKVCLISQLFRFGGLHSQASQVDSPNEKSRGARVEKRGRVRGLVSGLVGVKAEWLTDYWQMAIKTVHVQKRILNTRETRAAATARLCHLL
jgi:hypothetical protein